MSTNDRHADTVAALTKAMQHHQDGDDSIVEVGRTVVATPDHVHEVIDQVTAVVNRGEIAVTAIAAMPPKQSYFYTIGGVHHTGFEVLVVIPSVFHAGHLSSVVMDLMESIRDGQEDIEPGSPIYGALENGYPIKFIELDGQAKSDLMPIARNHYGGGDNFVAYHLLLPDSDRRLPGDEDYDFYSQALPTSAEG